MKYKPQRPPKLRPERLDLLKFINKVEIIIQTVNNNEYQAAVTFLEPPSEKFTKSVVFPSAGTVLGNFADHKTALIQTDVGRNAGDYIQDAIDRFPNAKFIIGIGIGYAFNRKKCKFGDVLVSKRIADLTNWKFNDKGEVINQGELLNVVNTLRAVFCRDMKFDEDFVVTLPLGQEKICRISEVHAGTFAYFGAQINNKIMHDHHIQILNSDLSYAGSFGKAGSGQG